MKLIPTAPFILVSFLCIFLSAQAFAASLKAASEKTSESSRAVFEAKASNVESYSQLLEAIREARAASEQRASQEKVRLAWETGNLINRHVLLNADRAAYGENVILRLAKDLETSETELRYMLQFAREYPIHPTSDELTWSDYREMLSLNDPKEREQLAEQAKKGKWDINRIRQEIKRANAAREGKTLPKETLHATHGKPGTYRVIKAKIGPYEDQLALDLGFSNYYQPGELKHLKEGDAVFAERDREGYALTKTPALPSDLYTYRAYVVEVIDGDTFRAIVDLGFEFVTEQKLRLRGLDAPELDTLEGKASKSFLESKLKKGAPVLIRTEKSDKYDRYLADVFVDGKYLNEELVEKKLAVAVE